MRSKFLRHGRKNRLDRMKLVGKPKGHRLEDRIEGTRSFFEWDTQSPELKQARYWNPIWLRSSCLLACGAAFVLLMAGLLLLFFLTKKYDGLPLHTTNHFSWTYGPTALLTIFVAFWRQIDFYCKTLTPWAELKRGNATSSRSVVLDYTSCLQIVSFHKAIKNKHPLVVLTIAGFAILKLVTLVSTGLFFPQNTDLSPRQVALKKITRLNGTSYDSSTNPALFDSSLAYTAFAVMAKGLSYAEGTKPEMVYERADLTSGRAVSNQTLITTVDAIVPNFQCQSAPVGVKLQPANVTDPHPEDSLVLQFTECTLRNAGSGTPLYALNPRNTVCPPRQLSPLLQQIDCESQTNSTGPENWQLLTMADFRYSQNFTNDSTVSPGDTISATSWFTSVQQLTGIACLAAFSVQKAQITYDFSNDPPVIQTKLLDGTNATQLEGFTGYDLGALTTSALMASADMFGNLVDSQAAVEYPNALFKMMAAVSGGSYEDLLNETTMIIAAQKVFQQVAIQSTAKYLVRSDASALTGELISNAERLQISYVSLWLMAAGALIMASFTFFLLMKRPKDVCFQNPLLLRTIAQTLASSGDFRHLLTQLGLVGDGELEQKLQGLKFDLADQPSADGQGISRILVIPPRDDHPANVAPDEAQAQGSVTWWSPLTIKRWVLVITIILPLSSIVVLEVLQHLSAARCGFAAVTGLSNTAITIYTRFIPALLMLLIATLINSLDFNVAVLAPYNALRTDDSKGRANGLLISLLGSPPPVALWHALRHRAWGAFATGLTALLSSLLTIVVSGLYTIQRLPVTQGVALMQLDNFNTSWPNSVNNDSSAAIVTSLTESLGLDYPQFTFEELAFPTLGSASSRSTFNATEAGSKPLVHVEIAALRGDLVCLQLPPEQVNVSASFDARIQTASAFVSANAALPASCPFGGSAGNSTNIEFDTSFTLRGNSSILGKLLDLHVGPFDSLSASSAGELDPNSQADNPPDCPSLALVYGHADANDPSETSVRAFMCYQYLDQVHTNVTFTWPELEIPANQSLPPTVDESSAKRLASGPDGQTAFQFRLQLHMDDQFSSFNQSSENATTTAGSSPPIDNFFQGLLFGREPLDPSVFTSEDQATASKVYLSIRGLYRRYMAQAISANMRVPASSASTTSTSGGAQITGTLSNARTQVRIAQNNTAKLILQIQLALILALVILAVCLTKLHEIVPLNPCCIAGVAALFARSRMCNLDDPIGQRLMGSDGGPTGMRRRRTTSFKLGWWECEGVPDEKWYGIDAARIDVE